MQMSTFRSNSLRNFVEQLQYEPDYTWSGYKIFKIYTISSDEGNTLGFLMSDTPSVWRNGYGSIGFNRSRSFLIAILSLSLSLCEEWRYSSNLQKPSDFSESLCSQRISQKVLGPTLPKWANYKIGPTKKKSPKLNCPNYPVHVHQRTVRILTRFLLLWDKILNRVVIF